VPLQSILTGLQAHPQGTDLADNSLGGVERIILCIVSAQTFIGKKIIIIKDMWQGTLYSVEPGQGPKLARNVHR